MWPPSQRLDVYIAVVVLDRGRIPHPRVIDAHEPRSHLSVLFASAFTLLKEIFMHADDIKARSTAH